MTASPQNSPEDNQQKLGKSMMIIAWIIAIVLLTWIFGAWEEKQFNPNASPDSLRLENETSVTLQRNRYGHYLVSGQVNQKNALFLLDTGATLVAVPGELQQRLGLIAGTAHMTNTANGTTKAYATTIDTLEIGDIVLTNVKASIVPNMRGEEILLGMSVLKQLEFSQKGSQLTLRQVHSNGP